MSGYYSVIQYSNAPESGEFINIGVALFSSEGKRVDVRFAPNAKRISRLYSDAPTLAEFKYVTQTFRKRLEAELRLGANRETLEAFAERRTSKVRMSQLRAIAISEIGSTLTALFEDYVPEIPSQGKRGAKVQTRLKVALTEEGVEHLLNARPDPIELSNGAKISAPYAYQNGSLNLIVPVALREDMDTMINSVSPFAIRGQQLAESSKAKLIVVGDGNESTEAELDEAEKILQSHQVRFFQLDKIKPLADEIRAAYEAHH